MTRFKVKKLVAKFIDRNPRGIEIDNVGNGFKPERPSATERS